MQIENFSKFVPKVKNLLKKAVLKTEIVENSKPFIKKACKQKTRHPKLHQTMFDMMLDVKEKLLTNFYSMDFVLKKQKLINELSKVFNKDFIAKIEKVKTPEQLAKIILKEECGIMPEYIYTRLYPPKSKPLTLETEQIRYQKKFNKANFILAREKAMHVPSKNPKVIAIENILKEQYGCKFVSLKDNEELAKKVLKAYEIASKNNVETPENVIASVFMHTNGEYLINGTILLNILESKYQKGFLSTNKDFHAVLHEIMHNTHPQLLSFNIKEIPERFLKVKAGLSEYSRISLTHETFTELNTKRLIDGLNPQEQALFDYLNIFA